MSNLMLGSSSYLLGTNDTADVLLNNISPMDANQPNGLADGIIKSRLRWVPGSISWARWTISVNDSPCRCPQMGG